MNQATPPSLDAVVFQDLTQVLLGHILEDPQKRQVLARAFGCAAEKLANHPRLAVLAQKLEGFFSQLASGMPEEDLLAIIGRVAEIHKTYGVSSLWLIDAAFLLEAKAREKGLPPFFFNGLCAFVKALVESREKTLAQTHTALETQRDWWPRAFSLVSTEGAFICTTPGEILWSNDAFARMLGYSPEELIGRSWQSLTPEEDVEEQFMESQQVLSRQGQTRYEKIYLHKDGRPIPVLLSYRPTSGEPFAKEFVFLCTVADLTEVRAREFGVFTMGPVMVFRWRLLPGWPAEGVSDNVVQLGYPKEDWISQKIVYENILHPEDLKRIASEVETYIREEKDHFVQEYRLVRADGSVIWVYDYTVNLKSALGHVIGMQGYVLDITEKKALEENLRRANQALEEKAAEVSRAEERWRLALEGASLAVWDWDLPSGKTFFSRQWKAYIGYGEDELQGIYEEWESRLHPDDKKKTLEALEKHLRGETDHYDAQFRLRRKDGSFCWIHAKAKAISRDAQGNPLRLIGVDMDITLQKENEEKLFALNRELEENLEDLASVRNRLQLILDSTAEGIYGYDTQGVCIFVNRAALEMLGYSEEELIGKRIHDLIHHTAEDGSPIPWESCPVCQTVQEGKGASGVESLHWRKNGTSFPVQMWAYPMREKGEVVGAVVSFLDVTERNAILRSLQREHELFASGPVVVFLCLPAPGWPVEYVSESVSQWGYAKEDFLSGKLGYLDVIPPEERKKIADLVETKAREGMDYLWEEHRFIKADGKTIWINGYMHVVRDTRGNVIRYHGYFLDITPRKALEEKLKEVNRTLEEKVALRTQELEALNKELEAFAYSVSHDLRAPLRAIDGFSQALLEDYEAKLDEEGKDDLRRVRSATQKMAQLIDDILVLSRVGRRELRLEKVNLSAMAEELARELRESDPQRQVQWVIAPGVEVMADGELLRIAMSNLIGNAWKYTSKKEKARIEFGVLDGEGRKVYFIRDNGAGFDMRYVNKLFVPFQRLHSASEFPGTGVGLATAQRVIRRHQGSIWAEGRAGEGATFYFTLG